VTLAEEHDFPQIEGLLSKYAQHLLSNGRRMEAVELYRKVE
jgi:WD repeat-containing protein 35